jgi:hypothetical protein
MYRALRLDKLAVQALSDSLRSLVTGDYASLPGLRMLMLIPQDIEARAKAREFEAFKLHQALSLACQNANTAKDRGVIVACIKRADEIRAKLVRMGELPETSL